MGDWFGRRIAIMIGALIFCLGGALQTAGQNLSFFYSGRAIGGVGVGILVMIVPMYQAEIAHPSIRGRVTGLQQLMLGIGAVVASKLCLTAIYIFKPNSLQHGLFMVPIYTIPRANSGASLSVFKLSPLQSLLS